MKSIREKLKFIELLDKMKEIKRIILLRNGTLEDDAQHSFHLAIMVITFAEDFPELNVEKCLKLALLHDIVEIYAGDTAVFDLKNELTKDKREKESLERIKREFWKVLPDIIDLLVEYEEKSSQESKFVYSLDKVQPIIQVVLEWWKAWHKYKIDFEKIKKRQYSKIYPEFWLEKILDIYFEKAEKEKIYYRDK